MSIKIEIILAILVIPIVTLGIWLVESVIFQIIAICMWSFAFWSWAGDLNEKWYNGEE